MVRNSLSSLEIHGAAGVGGDGDGKHFDMNYFWALGTMNLSLGFLDIIYCGKMPH